MSLRQLQVSHDAVEDRLLVRIATQSNEEIRIFLTRRFLAQLWPGLCTIQSARPQVSGQEEVQETAAPSFHEPYNNDDPTFPLGQQAFIASEANLEPQNDGGCRIALGEARGRSYAVLLSADLFDAFCAMLRAGSEQAEWQLGLQYDTPASQEATPASFPKPKPSPHLH